MSRDAQRGPKLPRELLDRVQQNGGNSKRRQYVSRKDRRKVERQQKKSLARQPRRFPVGGRRQKVESSDEDGEDELRGLSRAHRVKVLSKETKPLKSILKKSVQRQESESESEEVEEAVPAKVSRAVKERLADDDAEIAALEKRLGIKGKKSKALQEDGLDWIVGGSDDEDEYRGAKRKRPEDSKWLQDKRLKASSKVEYVVEASDDDNDGSDVSDEADDDDVIENPFSEDELDSDDFDGFELEDEQDAEPEGAPKQKRQRENPYVAPVINDNSTTIKYVPPSLRKAAASDDEALQQLRRQLQGLLNRLSEANMLSILKSLEDIYEKNARQHITSTLVDLLVGLVSDPSTLNDTFLILHAGFATAIYRVIGTDFGAQLLEKVVENITHFWDRPEGKETLNLLSFLSSLYIFQLVGSGLIFDYVRLLLDGISEAHTELLLRIIRTCGQQLRQDDPSALKDIVLLLQRSVSNVGEATLSVRTKFMIETINNLKNNRMRTGLLASALASEHTTAMKKTLGTLNTTRPIRATEPLRISLSDIQNSEKKGRWWLVGASYHDPAKLASNTEPSITTKRQDDLDAGYESETPGSVNLHKLARQQGMNTDVRRSIFITLLSSTDCKEAHLRLLKLHLKNKQMLEIPRVLIHCVGAEEAYNPFYALVARQFCGEHRMRKAFAFALWDAFKAMGERDEGDDDENEERMGVRKVVNLAKMYGSLVASRGLDLGVLKKVNLLYLSSEAGMFVEVMLTAVFTMIKKKQAEGMEVEGEEESGREKTIREIFTRAAAVPGLKQGLQYFLEKTVSKAELAKGKREKRAVEMGCEVAVEALMEAEGTVEAVDEDEDEYESGE